MNMKKDILRLIYKYKFIDKYFAKYFTTSEDEFINLYVNKKYLTLTDVVNAIKKESKSIEINEFFISDYNSKDECFGTFIDYFNTYERDKNLKVLNSLLEKTYKDDILSAIICVFFMVNNSYDKNFFVRSASIHLFLSLPIFYNYTRLFLACSLLFVLNSKCEDEFFDCKILISKLLRTLSVKELLILIDEQKLKEYFQIVFNEAVSILEIEQRGKYKVDDCHNSDDTFLFLSKTFDTYKWMDYKEKENLNILAKENIFYKEHAFYLESIGEKNYLSEMMIAELKGNCYIF